MRISLPVLFDTEEEQENERLGIENKSEERNFYVVEVTFFTIGSILRAENKNLCIITSEGIEYLIQKPYLETLALLDKIGF